MQPDTGGRFSLQLQEQDTGHACYALSLATGNSQWLGSARVSLDEGRVDVTGWTGPGEPPRWLLQYTRAALRMAWYQHRELGWPRRMTRWRDVPARAAPEDEGSSG